MDKAPTNRKLKRQRCKASRRARKRAAKLAPIGTYTYADERADLFPDPLSMTKAGR